jgi:hypothetical protein
MADAPAQTAPRPAPAGGHAVAADDHRHGWVKILANPVVMLFATAFVGFFWFIAMQNQINTDEVFYMSIAFGQTLAQDAISVMPHFGVFSQIGDLLGGATNVKQQMCITYAYFITAIVMIFAVGVSSSLHFAHRSTPQNIPGSMSKLAFTKDGFFRACSVIVFVWDGFTDFLYGPGTITGHVLFALLTSFVSFFFLPLFIACLMSTVYLFRNK